MDTFEEKYSAFLLEFGKGRKMVLSTAEKDRVTSRMMSIVQIDGLFYFQTDVSFRKYHQLVNNPNVALCIDNIQMEGICREIGRPMECEAYCRVYRECYSNSYEMYSSLEKERLFEITPIYIERWLYRDKIPFLEIFDIKKRRYEIHRYQLDAGRNV